jgi:hypothetical protein
MEKAENMPEYRDRRRVIYLIGVLLLLAGIAIFLLGPVEMYCFYLFSDGGVFHYEGFRFGSFMFGNIAGQIIGYYLIGGLLIPLGYGHLRLRNWARRLTLATLWFWLIVGAPLTVLVFFILLGSKDLTPFMGLLAAIFLGLAYFVLPVLFLRFYQSRDIKLTFKGQDTQPHWIDVLPIPILVLGFLYAFYVVVFHLLILFNGMFPMFGSFWFEYNGIILLTCSIACFLCLLWGTLNRWIWAWWGALIAIGVLFVSTLITLFNSSYASILAGLNFPLAELEILGGLPVQGYHFAILVGIPLLVSWVVVFLSRKHFRQDGCISNR